MVRDDNAFERECIDIELDLIRLRLDVEKLRYELKTYNPNQLRVPKGQPEGGQWSKIGGGADAAASPGGRLKDQSEGTEEAGNRARRGTSTLDIQAAVTRIQRDEAVRRAREVDPGWQPPQSLTTPGSLRGEIAANVAVRDAANAYVAAAMRPMSDILAPGGRRIGEEGASKSIRTLPPERFYATLNDLHVGARPSTRPDYSGIVFTRRDGSIYGVRESRKHGVTIDVMHDPFAQPPSILRIHQQ